MTMEFLLHKDKEKDNPPHIQAHCLLPDTQINASQKSKSQISKPTDLTYLNSIKNPFLISIVLTTLIWKILLAKLQ